MSVEIYCYRGAGDKEMDSIEDSMITDLQMARQRGTYEIDKQWYLVHQMGIEVPLKPNNSNDPINDGDIVTITESHLGISGKRRVTSITLSGTPDEVSMSVQLERFEEFL